MTSKKIAIIGAGAIGGYYGAKLARAGHDVWFLMRGDAAEVRKKGLTIQSIDGNFTLPNVNVTTSGEEIGPCDIVLVTLKSTSNDALKTLLPPLVDKRTEVLTLQNGLGNEEFLASLIPGQQVLGGLCFVCINRTAPGVIKHYAQGAIAIGEVSGPPLDRTEAIAALFRHAGIDASTVDNLGTARWRKLVWNIPFNGLAIAAGGLDTEKILNSPALLDLTQDLMTEVREAAEKLGHPLPEGLIDQMINSTTTMRAYKPSSLIDWEEGREIEVEAIWAEPLRRARAVGCPMPRLAFLTGLLRAAQERL